MAQAETEKLIHMMMGAALSRALCSVTELGIANHLPPGSPQPVASLASATGTHERSLYRLMRYLASHGVFQETANGQFDHTPLSLCLRDDAEGSFRAAGRMIHRMFPAWDGLHHAVLTGGPGFDKVFGQPIFEHIGQNPELAPIFDAGMTAFHGHETSAMLEAYNFDGIDLLTDVGGGNGNLIGAVLNRYPRMRGHLFDLGHVAARARENLRTQGVAERCEVVEGNFFQAIPGGADAYLFRHIIHDWTDEQSVQILGRCRQVIPPHGRLLIVESVVPTGNEPSLAKEFDMAMLAFPGGIERTAEEYRDLLEQAGFDFHSITPTKSSVSVVEGRPRA